MSRRKGSRNYNTLVLWEQIQELAEQYDRMTVRQAFYQLVARGAIDKTENEYERVRRNIVNMRRDGYLAWAFIVDFTRYRRQPESWDNIGAYIEHMKNGYRRDPWQRQNERVEIWLEKEALGALIDEVTTKYDVPLMVSHGLSSVTFLYESARHHMAEGKERHIYTLYDCDRSGDIAHASIKRDLTEFTEGLPVHVHRLGLTRRQVRILNIPTRPGKQGETIAAELDAIPPDTLQALVEVAIERHITEPRWKNQKVLERKGMKLLQTLEAPARNPQDKGKDV